MIDEGMFSRLMVRFWSNTEKAISSQEYGCALMSGIGGDYLLLEVRR